MFDWFRMEHSSSIGNFHTPNAGVSIVMNMNGVKRTRLQHKESDDDQKENEMGSPSAHSCYRTSRGRTGMRMGLALIQYPRNHFHIVTSLAVLAS